MICYKDMTFCKGGGCTKFDGCPRALTDEVQAGAVRWWGNENPPIAIFTEPQNLDCYNIGLNSNE